MSKFPSYNDQNLQQYFLNEEFVQKTILQIRKNLNQFGYEFEPGLVSDDPMNSLLKALNPIVEEFIKSSSEKFIAYLYIVDIDEKRLEQMEFGENYVENISFKIIKREAQKIFFQFMVSEKKI